MRPANVTDEDIFQWEQDRLISDEDHLIPCPADVWYAGCWMSRELSSLGCNEELASQICQATGQRQAYSEDHWQTAIEAIENWKRGVWDVPGPELAQKLIFEKYGNPPNAKRILQDMIKAGVNPEKLIQMMLDREMKSIISK